MDSCKCGTDSNPYRFSIFAGIKINEKKKAVPVFEQEEYLCFRCFRAKVLAEKKTLSEEKKTLSEEKKTLSEEKRSSLALSLSTN